MNRIAILTRLFVCSAVVAALSFVGSSSADAQDTATLKITFKYKGTAPTFDPVKPTRDEAFCGLKEIPEESLIVNPENNGIKNIVVWPKAGRREKLPETEPKTHVLANKECRFEPRLILASPGDTIRVTNPDKIGHNAKFNGFNLNVNPSVPAGGQVDVEIEDTEPTVIPVECNIHPWMKAGVLIVGHRFAGISDENGVVEIKGLPVGDEIEFQVNHETGTFVNVVTEIDGDDVQWKRNRFEMELKAGTNDLGVIEVPESEFDL